MRGPMERMGATTRTGRVRALTTVHMVTAAGAEVTAGAEHRAERTAAMETEDATTSTGMKARPTS